MYNNLVNHLNDSNIVYPWQFGFRKNHSTSDAIANLIGDILQSFRNGYMVLSVFIDLRKAFDSIPHDLVLAKLEKLGIRNTALDWFSNYLRNRKQFTAIKRSKAELRDVKVGIPQGSLLSVLLFQLTINDLPNCLRFCSSILYADDMMLYVIGRSLRFLKSKVQLDLEALSSWLSVNQLKLNVSKTKAILFNKEGLTPRLSLEVHNEQIETVSAFKIPGVDS